MNAKRALAALLLLAVGATSWWWSARERATDGVTREPRAAPAEEPRNRVELVETSRDEPTALTEPHALASEVERRAVEASPAPSDAARAEQATIVATFTAQETGAPLAGEHCAVRDKSGGGWGGPRLDSADGGMGEKPRSGEDGVVRLHVPPGSYAVHPDTTGVEPQDADDVGAGETRELTFIVRTRCDLVAYVLVIDVESRDPLPEVELKLEGLGSALLDATRTARTDKDGRASFRIPSWIAVRGEVSAPGYGPVRFQLSSLHDAPETALVLSLARSATLRGRVTDGSGVAVSGMKIDLQCYANELGTGDTELGLASFRGAGSYDMSRRTWSAATDLDGGFELAGLPAGVRLQVALHGGDHTADEEAVQLSPGEVRDVAYLLGGGALVRGVLLDADGEPCGNVPLWRVAGETSRMRNSFGVKEAATHTASDGTFELRDVAPGDWLVGPYERELPSWMTHVAVPPGVPVVDVVLRLPPELTVRGHTVDATGHAVGGMYLMAHSGGTIVTAESGEDGSFELGPLLDGAVTIEARFGAEGLIGIGPVQARAGDDDVVVVVVAGGELLVRVRDEAGRPVAAEVLRARVEGAAMDGISFSGTDAEGELTFPRLSPGLHRVLARVEGGLVGSGGPIRIEPGAHAEVDVIVRAGGRLRIRASEASGIERVRVIVGGMYTDFERMDSGDLTTKALPAGPARVEGVLAGGTVVTRDVSVKVGETVDVVFD